MKISYLIDSHPENGGAPISTGLIANEFSKIYNTSLILPSQNMEFQLNKNIEIREIGDFEDTFPSLLFNPIKSLKLGFALRKEIKKISPNILHVQMPRAAWVLGAYKFLNLLPKKVKYIYTDREHLKTYKWPLKAITFILIKLQYNEVVCLTDINKEYWGIIPFGAKVHTIPNAAGEYYEQYEERRHTVVRGKNNIDNNVFTVMFSGRMNAHKNWKLAEEIILNIKGEKITFIFAISTSGKEQEEALAKFRSFISETGINYKLFQNATQEEMAEYYYMADLFILTSNKESFGRTAIEAMSRKCVVVGRNVGGLPEVIGKNENILENDSIAFCNRILFYKINEKKLKIDKEWFYNRFINEYSLASNTNKHKILYEKLLNP